MERWIVYIQIIPSEPLILGIIEFKNLPIKQVDLSPRQAGWRSGMNCFEFARTGPVYGCLDPKKRGSSRERILGVWLVFLGGARSVNLKGQQIVIIRGSSRRHFPAGIIVDQIRFIPFVPLINEDRNHSRLGRDGRINAGPISVRHFYVDRRRRFDQSRQYSQWHRRRDVQPRLARAKVFSAPT